MTDAGNPTARLQAQLTRQLGPWSVVLTLAVDMARACARACASRDSGRRVR